MEAEYKVAIEKCDALVGRGEGLLRERGEDQIPQIESLSLLSLGDDFPWSVDPPSPRTVFGRMLASAHFFGPDVT